MNLQNAILTQFKQAHPEWTLRDIAAATGIQVTRVFRVFNGSEMKLSEYEKFEQVINSRPGTGSSEAREFFELSQECLGSLGPEKLKEMAKQLHRQLKIRRIKNK